MNGEMLSQRVQALRRDFDRGFTRPPTAAPDEGESVLAIRAGDEACAVPLEQVRGLFVDRKVVALPGRLPAFLGITCLRSGIVAVYSLRVLLGQAPADEVPRWLLLADGKQPFALAFEIFDAHARLPRGALAAGGTVLAAGERRTLLSLPSIAATLAAKS